MTTSETSPRPCWWRWTLGSCLRRRGRCQRTTSTPSRCSEASTNAKRPAEIVVFSVLKPSVCSSCGAEIGKGALLRMEKERPSCLACADLDHLVYLPAGDAALSRRSRKHSTLSAVVVRFSRARKRYERQGLLIELPALEQAEQECLSDQDQRARARERAGLARERTDANYVRAFGEAVPSAYPVCPR